jgi:hypothetical protein
MTPDFSLAHRITLPECTTCSGTREPGITRSVYEAIQIGSTATIRRFDFTDCGSSQRPKSD